MTEKVKNPINSALNQTNANESVSFGNSNSFDFKAKNNNAMINAIFSRKKNNNSLTQTAPKISVFNSLPFLLR